MSLVGKSSLLDAAVVARDLAGDDPADGRTLDETAVLVKRVLVRRRLDRLVGHQILERRKLPLNPLWRLRERQRGQFRYDTLG